MTQVSGGPLSDRPAAVLRQLLVDLSLGANGGADWPVYVGNEPDAPDNVITTVDTTPFVGAREAIGNGVDEKPGCQIRIRSNVENTGYAKANAILIALADVDTVGVTVDSTPYAIDNVQRSGGVLSPGPIPGTNLYLHAVNVILTMRQIT